MSNKEENRIKETVSKGAAGFQGTVDAIKEKTEDLIESSRKFADGATKSVHHAYGVAEDNLDDGLKTTRKWIKKYPFEAALAGVGVGLVLGFVFFGRRDR